MTTLEIINRMLRSTGTAPLTSNDTEHPGYKKAKATLDSVSNDVQGRGWWYNTATRTLKQNTGGEILIPSNAMHADPSDRNSPYVRRGNRLYDPANASYVIGEDVEMDLVDLVPVGDLPPLMASYIRDQSVYEYYLDEDGSDPKLTRYERRAQLAWVRVKEEHLKNADTNWFNGTSYAQMQRGVRYNRLPLRDS